jgi:hypothetical protein
VFQRLVVDLLDVPPFFLAKSGLFHIVPLRPFYRVYANAMTAYEVATAVSPFKTAF